MKKLPITILFLTVTMSLSLFQASCDDDVPGGTPPVATESPMDEGTPPPEPTVTPPPDETPTKAPDVTPALTPSPTVETPLATPLSTPLSTPPGDLDQDGVPASEDCDDHDAEIFPGGLELCDSKDNDCDGLIDDKDPSASVPLWYSDDDEDGYGDPEVSIALCEPPEGYVANASDCDDSSALFHPGAVEDSCADPNDYNCDGTVGYVDSDQDGFPACQDCQDDDGGINPSALEVCDEIDNNCDGAIDDEDPSLTGAPLSYADADGDGYGNPLVSVASCTAPPGYVASGTDCDDSDVAVHPETVWYADVDADGYGDENTSMTQCVRPEGYVLDASDCNDSDEDFNPGSSLESCSVALDYNCDGVVGYEDNDGDGFAACTECDDDNPFTYPDATESCDGKDNDCDGAVDEGVEETYYLDADEDGFGNDGKAVVACAPPTSSYIRLGGDCDDTHADIYPGTEEVCDGKDNNCDELSDDADPFVADPSSWYLDLDGDGYGDESLEVVTCEAPLDYVGNSRDCDDESAAIHPDSPELCDGIDNDCDLMIDDEDTDVENPPAWYPDVDGDGYGVPSGAVHQCEDPGGYSALSTDCNDAKADIHPGADERCDLVDNNCNGLVDDQDSGIVDPPTWYFDGDGDGYGGSTYTLTQCKAVPGYVSEPGDCNDKQDAINPEAPEVCNGVDDDCANGIDVGAVDASTFYRDADGDGYGDVASSEKACSRPSGFTDDATDCDDTRATVYPGAPELCDGVDNACDGGGDAGALGDDATCAASDCQAILADDPEASSGPYWIKSPATGQAYQTFCEMTVDGGGWTLVLQTSSSSAYSYSHAVWTATAAPESGPTLSATANQDGVSQAFYDLMAEDSMLCMSDLQHCAAWRHANSTARNLVGGSTPASAQTKAQDCTTTHCGQNSYPAALRSVTAGSSAWTYNRFGYLNYVNSWGTSIRVGFSGDGDSSDSSDTIIGMGLTCTGSCTTGSTTNGAHNTGSGYYAYQGWSVEPRDGALPGYLFVRPKSPELCGDGVDNDADGLVDEGVLGGSADCPARHCQAVLAADPEASDGLYWLDPASTRTPFQAYCDMTTSGGGWTLVLQTSTASPYTYSHTVWTQATQAGPAQLPTVGAAKDAVSQAFYSQKALESRLCMGDLSHCTAWNHGEGTPRDLANGTRMSSTAVAASLCSASKCGVNTLPTALRDASGGTTVSYWHRFGYVNDVNGWGTSTRVGFTGDIDTSDSSDTVIGLGLACSSSCTTNSTTNGAHGTGSGYYKYSGSGTAPLDNPLPGYLFIRSRWEANTYPGEICDDGIDNNGNGLIDEGSLGDSPGCAAASCDEILLDQPDAETGIYWVDIDLSGSPLQTYCDMTTDGGGWTLVLQTSHNSAYGYSHAVWTASAATSSQIATTDPSVSQDALSPGFYTYRGGESMLCMGDLNRCNAWVHSVDTPRNLANGPRMTGAQTAASLCSSFYCGKNTLPTQIRDSSGGTNSNTWHRWGYVNDVNGWGTSTRIGFTGDNDSSDSSDTIIGLGLACTGSCLSGSATDGAHGTGSGYYKYSGWSTSLPLDGPLKGYLFVR